MPPPIEPREPAPRRLEKHEDRDALEAKPPWCAGGFFGFLCWVHVVSGFLEEMNGNDTM